ncbi:MAG: DNA polymerase III subunit alpha [Chitinivibrionales bacterium]|nr:DNA polymerase III subunit alpha [Chitinivibrionales bacterium]
MKEIENFVHLHNHTEYSFLDGAIKIPDLVKRAGEFNMPALAITDHGGLFGAIEFYETCQSAGIKPIIGFEAYVAPKSRFDKTSSKDEKSNFHLVLLAKDNEGYKNLMRLSSIGYIDGFYYKPRIDYEVLRQHSKGIIASSACLAGEIPRALLGGDMERAKNVAREYLSIFGENNFFIELENHNIKEEVLIQDQLITLARELGIPLIATNDAHYLGNDDALSHEILLCIQTQNTMDNPNRYKFSTDQIYFKSPQEMYELFKHVPEAMTNTMEIAERCEVKIKEKPVLPVPDVPGGHETLDAYLAALARNGLGDKYPEITPRIEERLAHELNVIESMGFAGYFLIVRDFVRAAKDMGIMVGCRGSAAGSLVAYSIGITDVDPIKYDLIFERFLNPERVSMPDADIDFSDRDRYRVIDYVVEKYGRDAVCQIINFGRMKAKMVVKDVARAMGVPVADANKLSSMITEKTLTKSIAENGELKRTIDSNAQYQELFKHAERLEGLARQAGMHAGGVIIAPGEVVNWAPLFKQASSDIIMTQFDMGDVEKAGLVKMDFLGLRTLTVLQETLRLIKKYRNEDIDLWGLADRDPETMELFGRGETVGIFQFESQGMQDNLRKLKPEDTEDLIAMNALYRPGPMDNIPTYIHRKHGKEKIEYLHPLLEDILKVTYGVIIYQEQVMRIAQVLGGFSLGQADLLRRAMGKKKIDKMEEMRPKFIEGAKERDVSEKTAKAVWDLMAKFAEYGFNKAHATVYAHVAYQSGYLKTHYPLEYMTANLTSWLGNQDQFLVMKNEAQRMGIKILPPDINYSEIECSVEGPNIRLGLGAIKNVGRAGNAMIECREKNGKFASLFDLCRIVDLRQVNKKALECLTYAGALDSLKGTRAQLHEAIDKAIEYGSSFQKDKLSGQTSLFDTGGTSTEQVSIPEPELPEIPPWPYTELLAREKDVLNYYISGHPLDRFQDEIRGFTTITLSDDSVASLKDGQTVTVGGLITIVKTHVQKNGRQMAFVTLEDFNGSAELLIFSDTLEKFGNLISQGSMILTRGQVTARDNKPKIKAENIIALSETREKLTRSVHVKIRTQGLEPDFLSTIEQQCKNASGPCSFIIHLLTQEENEYRIKSRKVTLNPANDTIDNLRKLVGKENVWLSKTAA